MSKNDKKGINKPPPKPLWQQKEEEYRRKAKENEENLKKLRRDSGRDKNDNGDMGGSWSGTDEFGNS